MAKQAALSVNSPGKYGLNTESAADVLGLDWCTEAQNCVFDINGRLGSRKGWAAQNSSAISGSPDVQSLFEYIDSDGTSTIISAAGGAIYSGLSPLTDLSGSLAPSNNHWKFQNFNGKVVGWQAGEEPIVYNGSGTFDYIVESFTAWSASTAYVVGDLVKPTSHNGYYYECTTAGTSGASEPTWDTTVGGTTSDNTVTWTTREIPKGNDVLAAFGRIWALNSTGDIVYFSGLLDETDYLSTSAGSINLNYVWNNGQDTAQAIAAFNNNLIIFGKRNIIVYASADDPLNLYLADVIKGIGIVGRDTVQNIGTDLLFLSQAGIRSLSRTITQDTMPMTTVTKHIDKFLSLYTANEDVEKIKSIYFESDGFYLINFPTYNVSFCLDVRSPMQGNIYRTTTWNNINPTALLATTDKKLYLGEPGYIGLYSGYNDNESSYQMLIKFGWEDFQDLTRLKYLKKLQALIYSGASNTVTFSWAFNFSFNSESAQDAYTSAALMEWGISEWGIAEWSGGANINPIAINATGGGSVIQLYVSADIVNSIVSLQRLDIFAVGGKLTNV